MVKGFGNSNRVHAFFTWLWPLKGSSCLAMVVVGGGQSAWATGPPGTVELNRSDDHAQHRQLSPEKVAVPKRGHEVLQMHHGTDWEHMCNSPGKHLQIVLGQTW